MNIQTNIFFYFFEKQKTNLPIAKDKTKLLKSNNTIIINIFCLDTNVC